MRGWQALKKIFVKSVNWVGDAVMVTPMLSQLRRNFADAEITLLARPSVSDVFESNPDIDRLWVIRENQSWSRFYSVCKRIRLERFDLGVSLPNSIGAALLMSLGGIKRRVGYRRDGRGFLLSDAIAVRPEDLQSHEVDYYLNLLQGLGGVDDGEKRLVLEDGAGADDFIVDVLRKNGVAVGEPGAPPLIGISPGAAFGTAKRWLPERFAAVASELIKTESAHVLLLGTPGERAVCKKIAEQIDGPVTVLAGKFPLRGLIALCNHLSLLISNDSGAMHIAAAKGVPLVAVWGPTNWLTTTPYSNNSVVVREHGVCDIAPCMKPNCIKNDHVCMTRVRVDQVYRAAQGLMGSGSEPKEAD